jgi:hypothetical protein
MIRGPAPLPPNALLRAYELAGGYVDCYSTDVPLAVTHAQYVEAFYCTALFKTERAILRLAIDKPSTDAQARALAAGTLDAFAAWTVEKRAENQLLMCDIYGSTRSWLMSEPIPGGTRLYFGSAVVPKARKRPTFAGLLWFHKVYSKALLWSAARRLRVGRG